MSPATRFEIEAGASTARVEARSSLHPLVATADRLRGFLDVELAGDALLPDAGVAGRLEVPVDRLRSGNALIDRETARRVDVRRHPMIVGELEHLAATGEGLRYRARGRVTFHGVTRPAAGVVEVEVAEGGGRLRLRGEQIFDVRDFALEPPRLLVLKVHADVRVRIDVSARRAAPGAATGRRGGAG